MSPRFFSRDRASRTTKRLRRADELMNRLQTDKALPILTELHEELAQEEDHLLAGEVEYRLAACYWMGCQEDKAIPLAEHAYRMCDEPFTKGSRCRLLGMCHLTTGRTEEGTRLFEESLVLLQESRPLAALTTKHALQLAGLHQAEQRWARVAELLEMVLTGYREGEIRYTIDNFDVFRIRWSLSIAYWHERRFDDVRTQLTHFVGYEPLFAHHPHLRRTHGQASAILNYLERRPQAIGPGEVLLEDIVGEVHDDWRYQGLLYKGRRAEGGWGTASAG